MSEGVDDNRHLARIPGTLTFKKRETIWYAMNVCALSGAVQGLTSREDALSDLWIVGAVLLWALALRWFSLDSEQLGRRIGRWMVLTIFLIPIVGVPIYLLRTRGMRRGLVACAVFTGFFCLLMGLEFGFEACVIAIVDWRQGG